MLKTKTTVQEVPWSLNLRTRVGDTVTHGSNTWVNITGKNSEPGIETDWEAIASPGSASISAQQAADIEANKNARVTPAERNSWNSLASFPKPIVHLITPNIVQPSATLSMTIKATYLDNDSTVSITGITLTTLVIDVENGSITFNYNSPEQLGTHNIYVSNSAGQTLAGVLTIATDSEIVPATSDWELSGTYISELTVENDKIYPNVETSRIYNQRVARLKKHIIPANQNFSLLFKPFYPVGYTSNSSTFVDVRPVASNSFSVYKVQTLGNNMTARQTVGGTSYWATLVNADDFLELRRVNGLMSFNVYNTVSENRQTVLSNAISNTDELEVVIDLFRVGGVQDIKLILNY